jgi:hypothetical protein
MDIMKTELFSANLLNIYLKKKIVATLDELKEALGTSVSKTVTRKLNELAYMQSYSHGGSYYSLKEFAQFNQQGVFSIGEVRFSQHGTLVETLVHFVTTSEKGCFAKELKKILFVSVQETLLRLVRSGRIARKKVSGLYLYCSLESSIRKQQIMRRQVSEKEAATGWISDESKAAIILFVSLLNEKQRRLFAGLESIMWGYGGDKKIADLLGINKNTVAKGRRQLLGQNVNGDTIRRSGGGRKPVKKNS